MAQFDKHIKVEIQDKVEGLGRSNSHPVALCLHDAVDDVYIYVGSYLKDELVVEMAKAINDLKDIPSPQLEKIVVDLWTSMNEPHVDKEEWPAVEGQLQEWLLEEAKVDFDFILPSLVSRTQSFHFKEEVYMNALNAQEKTTVVETIPTKKNKMSR